MPQLLFRPLPAKAGRTGLKRSGINRPESGASSPRPCAVLRAYERFGTRRLFRAAFAFLLMGVAVFAWGGAAFAAEKNAPWTTLISEHPALPYQLIAVDKSKQQLAVFERTSPLRLSRSFLCTTGQAVGDKMVEGDLKTPEGIYFVVQRIGSGLDFVKYGYEAYTLNYPNPIDRLRGKTGYGIWIHGRGEPLTPLQTEGCVSMDNNDLAFIGKVLAPGTPVALTESFSYGEKLSPAQVETIAALEKKVHAWAAAWSGRSAKFFDFYDKEAYSIAQGESFSAFQAQKERLFTSLPWIQTTARHVQVLEGPGYWVTWFYQDYQASNLSTKGIRRLYWHKDANSGDFKILGMEWQPGMGESTLVASADAYLPPAEPGATAPVWPAEMQGTDGSFVAFAAKARAVAEEAKSAPSAETASGGTAVSGRDARQTVAAPSPQALALARQRLAEASAPPRNAGGPSGALSHPGIDLPPPLPAQRLAASAPAYPALLPESRAGNATPVQPARSSLEQPQTPSAPAPAPALAAPPQAPPAASSLQTQPVPAATPDAAPPPDPVHSVPAQVDAWRKAWEDGDLDAYMSFYAPQAVQGSRRNAKAIRKHKEGLWLRAAPAQVLIEDLRVMVKGGTVKADMRQEYKDMNNGGDTGLKTLTFTHSNGVWLITQEDWSPLPNEAGN